VVSKNIFEYSMRYDDNAACKANPLTGCSLTFELAADVKGPVFFYYEIT
jgi:hypothetical protein